MPHTYTITSGSQCQCYGNELFIENVQLFDSSSLCSFATGWVYIPMYLFRFIFRVSFLNVVLFYNYVKCFCGPRVKSTKQGILKEVSSFLPHLLNSAPCSFPHQWLLFFKYDFIFRLLLLTRMCTYLHVPFLR